MRGKRLIGSVALAAIALSGVVVFGVSQLPQPDAAAVEAERRHLAGLEWERVQQAVTTPPPPAPPLNPPPPEPDTAAATAAIAFAKAQLGEAYELGSMGPELWDCSGLTKASYASIGVSIGAHSASRQFSTLKAAGRLVPLAQMAAGDLLWYSTGGSTSATKYHTTMYVGQGMMIEAARPGTVVRIVPIRYGDLVPYAGRPTP